MSYFLRDSKNTLHSLRSRPGFALSVILTLGITIGAFITMFTLNYTVLLKPLPYPQAERLAVAQGERYNHGELLAAGIHSYAGAVDAYKNNPVFSQSALLFYEDNVVKSLDNSPKLFTTSVTPEIFSLLGTQMAVGRYFGESEELYSYRPRAVISYQTWVEQFNKAADILEQSVQIENRNFKIIGVLSETFVEPELFRTGRKTHIWLPFDYNKQDEATRRNYTVGFMQLKLMGKLRPGVHPKEASYYFSNAMNDRYLKEISGYAYAKTASVAVKARSLEEIIIGDGRTSSLLLLLGVLALLLIACANICNLFLSRAAEKQRQYAIQATLGASKFHIFQAIFIECFILIGAANLLALFLSQFGILLLQQHAVDYLPRLEELSIGPVVLFFTLVLAVLLTSLFALLISNLIDYKALNNVLRSSGKGSGIQISRRTRDLLIVSQVALACVLLVANLTVLKSSVDVLLTPPGFKTEDAVWVEVTSGNQYINDQERLQYMRSILQKLQQLPEISGVSNSLFPPQLVDEWTSILTDTLSGQGASALPNVNQVDEHYLPMFDLTLMEGRNFRHHEIRDAQRVIILNETLANSFSSSDGILGKNLYWDSDPVPYKVIGVVKDIYVPGKGKVPQLHIAGNQWMTFLIAFQPGQTLSKSRLEEILNEINPNFVIWNFANIHEQYEQLLARDIAISAITVVLSLLTLMLSGLGIYGVLNYSVNLRTYELGVRMALGGSPVAIAKLVFGDSFKPAGYGLLAAFAILGLVYLIVNQTLSFNPPVEVSAFVVTLCLVLSTVAIACYLPLSRIVTSYPIRSLR